VSNYDRFTETLVYCGMFYTTGSCGESTFCCLVFSVRKKVVVEVIDVALAARLNHVSVAVCNQERIITNLKITGE
jgi:hypothetical protein